MFPPVEIKLSLHKNGCKDDIANYSHISLTCLVMKIFVKTIKEDLPLKTAHLIDKRNHEFLSKKSCTTNMIIL